MENQNDFIEKTNEDLPPNSFLHKVKLRKSLVPPNHLLRLFKNYVNKNDNQAFLPEIDYYEFGTKWLSLFNYAAHPNPLEIPLMDWVDQVSKNPYRAVKIMKHVDGVYTCVAIVPPLFDNTIPIMKNDDRDYFVNMSIQQSSVHLAANKKDEANGFIERNITNRISRARMLTENYHKMSEIFKLYGVERPVPSWLEDQVKTADTTSTNQQASGSGNKKFVSAMIEED